MIRRLPIGTKVLATLLLALLAALCLGDLAQAAVMRDVAPADCASRLCDQHAGCNTPTAVPVALPLTALTRVDVVGVPSAGVLCRNATEPPVVPDRPVAPRASRSPPVP